MDRRKFLSGFSLTVPAAISGMVFANKKIEELGKSDESRKAIFINKNGYLTTEDSVELGLRFLDYGKKV